jgi:site-specific recombinase XerD
MNVRGSRLPAGRALSQGEIRALFVDCARDRNRAAGARDAALLALLYGCGLRRAEAVVLEVADYNRESGELQVRGKGDKERLAHLGNGARAALEAWLEVRGQDPGALLCPVGKGGGVKLRAMTAQAVLLTLRKRARQAGVDRFSPHDLRRSFISDLLDAGADVATVQALAGHANVQTTTQYDRRPDEAKRRAVELLHVPFSG